MKVIGIVGTNGAGKGTVVEILQKKFDLTHISARQMIIDLAKSDGIDIANRDDLREYNENRNRQGKSLIQDLNSIYNVPENENKTFLFESIRRIKEIKELKNFFAENFLLLGVDADIELRYQRAVKRASMSDDVSFEKFKEQEKLEINSDENQMNVPACLSLAQFKIDNSGDLERLEKQVDVLVDMYPGFFAIL